MVYGIHNELVTGAYKPTNITGGGHISGPRNCYAPAARRAPGVEVPAAPERGELRIDALARGLEGEGGLAP